MLDIDKSIGKTSHIIVMAVAVINSSKLVHLVEVTLARSLKADGVWTLMVREVQLPRAWEPFLLQTLESHRFDPQQNSCPRWTWLSAPQGRLGVSSLCHHNLARVKLAGWASNAFSCMGPNGQ